jgi:hypothetical protein
VSQDFVNIEHVTGTVICNKKNSDRKILRNEMGRLGEMYRGEERCIQNFA